MTAKEYLNCVRLSDKQIEVKREELYRLKLNATQMRIQTIGDKVKSSGTSNFMQTIDKIVDMQNEINDEIDELVNLKQDVRSKINMLEDDRFKIILTDYYINCKTWHNVIKDNYISERTAYRLHGLALQEFRKKFGYE